MNCLLCDEPCFPEQEVVMVYLAHGNGGAYGTAVAHKSCKGWKCPRCGMDRKGDYARCEEGCDDC